MKKQIKLLMVALVFFALAAYCFAEKQKVADIGGEEIVEKFLRVGDYIKVIESKDNIEYYPKTYVPKIHFDGEDLDLAIIDGFHYGKGVCGWSVNKYDIKLDESSNIIITKKKNN